MGTLDQAVLQKDDITKKLETERRNSLEKIYEVFRIADADGNGELTKEEFINALGDPEVIKYLHQVEIDMRGAEGLFDILDYDESGSLDTAEFIEGCMRARGDAKAKDVLAVQCDLWRTQQWVRTELDKVNTNMMSRFDRFEETFRT